MSFLNRLGAASVSPVTLAEAKAHLRVDTTDEDTLISGLLDAANATVQEMTGRTLAAETWALTLASVSGDLLLPKSPVTGLTAIDYFAPDGTASSSLLSDFDLLIDTDQAVVRPKIGAVWPVTQTRPDAITITFTAGYGTLPAPLRIAILMLVAHWFENREAVNIGHLASDLPLAATSLIDDFRLGWVAA